MDVNGGPNATQGPCDGFFKSTYIEGGLDATINARLNGVDGLVFFLGIVNISRYYAWHGHPLISSVLTFLHSTIQLSPNLPHLMSLFSIPLMFPTTFLSRFPLTTQNLNSLFLYHAYTTFHIMEAITYVTLLLSLP
jgi:hypothetical protein